jgi:cytochrome P450
MDSRHLRQFFLTLRQVIERLQRRWQGAAERQQPVDVQKDLMRYTVDVTTNLAFGYDMNTLEKEGDVIQRHLEKIFPIISRRIFAPLPYWRYVKLPSDRALDDALVEIRKTIHAFIAHSRQQLAQHPHLAQHPTNLLEAMLVARDESEAHFHADEIFGNVFTMLLAGEDTTANTLAWAMHFMTERPDVQTAMQTEVDAVLGSATMLQDFAQSRQLAYVEAVAYETMRLKPVAPILGLETNVEVEVDGLRIPRDTSIILLTRPGVLQEHNFPQAEAFQPERWLAGQHPSRHTEHHKAFMPFGAGPRLCPGRSLALLEMQTALAMTCRNFVLAKASPAPPVDELFAFTMMPMHLSVRFSPRGTK